jgi:ATP-dependent DNA helicase DinG
LAQVLALNCDLPVFVQSNHQGQQKLANEQLIAQFKAVESGVLLGTGSFWEGLDLSGVPLSAVVIDKLPFASPEDPLLKLRSAELNLHGVDSFEQALLPDAVIRFQQGCGRLLRRLSDRGIIMVADPRLHTKAYGRAFIDSVNFSQVSDIKAVADFIAADTHSYSLTAALTSEIE